MILRYVRKGHPASTEFLVAGGRYVIGGDGGPVLETPLQLKHPVETYGLRLVGRQWTVGLVSCTGYLPEIETALAGRPPDPQRRLSRAAGRDPPGTAGCPPAHQRHAAAPGRPHALRPHDAARPSLGSWPRRSRARRASGCLPPGIAGGSISDAELGADGQPSPYGRAAVSRGRASRHGPATPARPSTPPARREGSFEIAGGSTLGPPSKPRRSPRLRGAGSGQAETPTAASSAVRSWPRSTR